MKCAPDWSANPIEEEEIEDMVLLPGTGSHFWKINTHSDSAQLYFNQGINLYYGFHIIEALPSFKKANCDLIRVLQCSIGPSRFPTAPISMIMVM